MDNNRNGRYSFPRRRCEFFPRGIRSGAPIFGRVHSSGHRQTTDRRVVEASPYRRSVPVSSPPVLPRRPSHGPRPTARSVSALSGRSPRPVHGSVGILKAMQDGGEVEPTASMAAAGFPGGVPGRAAGRPSAGRRARRLALTRSGSVCSRHASALLDAGSSCRCSRRSQGCAARSAIAPITGSTKSEWVPSRGAHVIAEVFAYTTEARRELTAQLGRPVAAVAAWGSAALPPAQRFPSWWKGAGLCSRESPGCRGGPARRPGTAGGSG